MSWLPPFRDLYHWLLVLPWPYFLGGIFFAYLAANVVFASLYLLCGPRALQGLLPEQSLGGFLDAFFFSVQTIATIGYGKLHPISFAANAIVTIESVTGLIGFALVTGLMFARFSRPTARVVFSNVAVIKPEDGKQVLSFRLANERTNQIVEAQVRFVVITTKTLSDGERRRSITDLKLARDATPIFTNSWSVFHVIDERSPIFGCTPDSLEEAEAEFLVSLVGIDNTFAQPIHARHFYLPHQLRWDHRFEDLFVWNKRREYWIDLSKIHETKPI